MKKLFSIGLVGSSLLSLTGCFGGGTTTKEEKKTDETTKKTDETTTATVSKGKIMAGTFKVGVVGELANENTTGVGKIKEVINRYTQDFQNPSANGNTGEEYYNLPRGVFLKRATQFNIIKNQDAAGIKSLYSSSDTGSLAEKNLDAAFINVKDTLYNSSEAYKAIVEKKLYKNTKLFLIGEKAKSQSGASSKTFAGGSVSTASFDANVAAYIAGFQAAVSKLAINSEDEDKFEETSVSFMIGAISDTEAKRKAFAFRRGVEAAAAHPLYSSALKVKFVSKTADESSTKRLYRDYSDWTAGTGEKGDITEFTSSDTFADGDYKVMYIAGTTGKQWTGHSSVALTTSIAPKTAWVAADDQGLIGAITKEGLNGVANKKFGSKGVSVVLDAGTINGKKANGSQASNGSGSSTRYHNFHTIVSNEVIIDDATDNANRDILNRFNRHGFKVLGIIGNKLSATGDFTTAALSAAFLGGANYMIGKHTNFGGGLLAGGLAYDWRSAPANDKMKKELKKKMNNSLSAVFSAEINKEKIIASSPWMK